MTTEQLAAALSEPFEANEVKWKPAMVKNNRCLAMGYIDARVVQDRLDDVLGIAGWQTEYHQVGPDNFECRLSIRIDGQWVTKADVGSTSEQPDAGDRLKAAYSDALKRAAVAFGIGRYLYRLPSQWVDFDPVKKLITQLPQLPTWALPTAPDAAFRERITNAATLEALASLWDTIPAANRPQLLALKDARKQALALSNGSK